MSPAKVAEAFSVHRSTVHRWMKRTEKEGLYNLKCKPGRGVKSFLTEEQVFELRKALSEPIPTDDGFSRGWQTKDAIQFVREKFGISYSKKRLLNPNHIFVTQDESGFCVDSNRSKCWAIKGSKEERYFFYWTERRGINQKRQGNSFKKTNIGCKYCFSLQLLQIGTQQNIVGK